MSDKTKRGAEGLLRRHDIMDLKSSREYLESAVRSLKNPIMRQLAEQPLACSLFWSCPAARGRHKAYSGGLAIHTAQMLLTAVSMVQPIPGARIDSMVLAAVWHDFGKIFDYEEITSENAVGDEVFGTYRYTQHKDLIGHLAKSYALFMMAQAKLVVSSSMCDTGAEALDADFVGHLILAHHGRQEWGSPVEPQCAEAWALHCGDMMSAQFIKDYNN